MKIIVAIDEHYAIGKDNELLFKIPKDLENFKNLTTGKVIVYGYNTLETFPNQKPLKNRINIVLTTKNIEIEGAIVVNSLKEAFKELEKYNTDDIFIVGGESIYKQFLNYCDTCYLTKVHNSDTFGNKFFPKLEGWKTKSCIISHDGHFDYTYSQLINPNVKKFEK